MVLINTLPQQLWAFLETSNATLSDFHITVFAVLNDKTEDEKCFVSILTIICKRTVKHGSEWGEVMKVKNAENGQNTEIAEITLKKSEQFAIIETSTVIKSISVQKVEGGAIIKSTGSTAKAAGSNTIKSSECR